MAVALAAEMAARTNWPVPLGLDPVTYLGAVLTERQRREWARATGQAMTSAPAAPPVIPAAPTALPIPAAPTAAQAPLPPTAPAPVNSGPADSGFTLPG